MRLVRVLIVDNLGWARFAFVLIVGRMLYLHPTQWGIPSVLLMIGVACDLLDGPLARRWNVATDFGDGLDYLSDRFLLLSPLAGVAASEAGLPYWSHGHLSSRVSILVVLVVVIAIMTTDFFPEGMFRDIGQGCVWWPLYGYYIAQVIASESGMPRIWILSGAVVTFSAMAITETRKRDKPSTFVYAPGSPDRSYSV